MALYDLAFYVMALIVVLSGVVVVTSRKMMYSAFSLLFTFFGVAGLYVLLNADFIAVTQIMVYIGGILVLLIFGVMLTSKITGIEIKTGTVGKFEIGLAGAVSLCLATFLGMMFMNTKWIIASHPEVQGTIHAIGVSLYTEYLLAFLTAAILLLVAFIGAAKIARRK